jgi:hypothetical protein
MKHGHGRSKGGWIGSTNFGLALVTCGVVFLVVGVGVAAGASTFAVGVDSTNLPVAEGDTLVVTAEVENTGNEVDAQEITLEVGGEVRDSTEVRIGAGESETVELTWGTGSSDGGSYTAVVASGDDEDSTEVSVEESETAEFVVSLDSTNPPVVEGDVLEVTTTVENTGDTADTQEIVLTVNGVERDSRELTLDPGASFPVTLGWETGSGDAGSYEAAVVSEDDSDSTGVTVDERTGGPAFDVRFAEIPSSVELGQAISVVAEIVNSGDEAGGQTVTIEVDGEVVSESTVELAPGDASEVGYEFEPDEAGDFNIVAASEDDSDSMTVQVEEVQFSVEIIDVTVDGDVTVDLSVVNEAGVEASQEVTASAAGIQQDSSTVQLGANEERTMSFEWNDPSADTGDYDVEVASETDRSMETLALGGADDDSGGSIGDSSTAGTALILVAFLGVIVGVYYISRRRGTREDDHIPGGDSGDGGE